MHNGHRNHKTRESTTTHFPGETGGKRKVPRTSCSVALAELPRHFLITFLHGIPLAG